MGFFTKDPLQKLKDEAAKKPNDPKAQMDLGAALKSKGDTFGAVEAYLNAASIFEKQGFDQKAVAAAGSAAAAEPNSVDPLERIVTIQLRLNHKEAAREALKKLHALHLKNKRTDEASAAWDRIQALGPGR
jgi:tetratricopeptide (TPR) repeat protein